MLGQRHGSGDQALERCQRPGIQLLGRQRRGQAARIRDQPRHQPLAERIVGGGGEEVVVAEPGGDPRARQHPDDAQRPHPAAQSIHSATSARARNRAASVPSARRSRSQVKPCAAAVEQERAGRPSSKLPAAARARRRRISNSPRNSLAPRPGSPGQGSRTGNAGASGTRPMRRLGSRAIARRASRNQRRGSDALMRRSTPHRATRRLPPRSPARRTLPFRQPVFGTGGDHIWRRSGRDAAIHRQRDRSGPRHRSSDATPRSSATATEGIPGRRILDSPSSPG